MCCHTALAPSLWRLDFFSNFCYGWNNSWWSKYCWHPIWLNKSRAHDLPQCPTSRQQGTQSHPNHYMKQNSGKDDAKEICNTWQSRQVNKFCIKTSAQFLYKTSIIHFLQPQPYNCAKLSLCVFITRVLAQRNMEYKGCRYEIQGLLIHWPLSSKCRKGSRGCPFNKRGTQAYKRSKQNISKSPSSKSISSTPRHKNNTPVCRAPLSMLSKSYGHPRTHSGPILHQADASSWLSPNWRGTSVTKRTG